MSDRRKMTGRLGYNQDNGRYGLLVTDLWERDGDDKKQRILSK